MSKILRINQVVEKVGMSRFTIYRRVKEGKFPKSFVLGCGNLKGWRESDIDEWIDKLAEANK